MKEKPVEQEVYETPFTAPLLTHDEMIELWKKQDRQEINELIGNLQYFQSRVDSHAFNPKLRRSLDELVFTLKRLKKQLVNKYYEDYGHAKTV